MKIVEIFSERLKKLRLENDESQAQTGANIGVSKVQISEMESGLKMTTSEKIAHLALHFGVTTDYLLGLSDDPKKSKAHKPGTGIEDVLKKDDNK